MARSQGMSPQIARRELWLARGAMALALVLWAVGTGPHGGEAGVAHGGGVLGAVLFAWCAAAVLVPRARRPASTTVHGSGVALLVDVAFLTAALSVSGGAAHPLTALYFVPLSLATHLSPRWTVVLAAAVMAGFALLFVADGDGPAAAAAQMMDSNDPMTTHLRGMWLAYAMAAGLVAFFVHRVALARATERAEIDRLQRERLETRHLSALGTLAAGAAHELATPLGTIELLAADLDRMDARQQTEAVAEIRRQLGRCRRIVDDMASPELVLTGARQRSGPFVPRDLAADLGAFGPPDAVTVTIDPSIADLSVHQPYAIVKRQIREVITNALRSYEDAVLPSPAAWVHLTKSGGDLEVTVEDRGPGLTPEVLERAFDPFYSARPDGSGTGLGLFLVRAQLRRMGGNVTLANRPGGGTRVTLRWPIGPDETP